MEKAKEYMAAAGLETLDLRLDLQDTTEYRTWAEIVQQNLKEIGINLELNPMESSAYWSTSFGEDAVKNNELLDQQLLHEPRPGLGHHVVHLRPGHGVEHAELVQRGV